VRGRSPAAAFEAFGHSRSRIPGTVGPGDRPASRRRSPLPASPFGSGRAWRLVHLGAAVLIRQPGMIQIGFKSMSALDYRIDEARAVASVLKSVSLSLSISSRNKWCGARLDAAAVIGQSTYCCVSGIGGSVAREIMLPLLWPPSIARRSV